MARSKPKRETPASPAERKPECSLECSPGSEGLFRALLEAGPDPVVLVNQAGTITLVNPQLERVFGYRPDEVLGQPIEILMPERFRSGHGRHLRDFFRAPRMRPMGIGMELAASRRDGREFPIEVSLSPLGPDHDRQVMAVIRDITERKQVDRLKDEFISVISHELRTPLNFITGFASLLDDEAVGALSARQHEFLGKILEGSQRMVSLIDDLLDASRMAAGQLKIQTAPVLYEAMMRETLEEFRPLAARRGLALRTELDACGVICVDARRIVQVLSNLLDNALKFSPPGGTITVRSYVQDASVISEVQDTGHGIEAEQMEHLFKRFSQIDMSSTRVVGGAGLGLFICKNLVEAHGGEIGVYSPGSDQGSTFWFRLPRDTTCE